MPKRKPSQPEDKFCECMCHHDKPLKCFDALCHHQTHVKECQHRSSSCNQPASTESELSKREKAVLKYRINHNLEETGKEFGIKRQKVREIEEKYNRWIDRQNAEIDELQKRFTVPASMESWEEELDNAKGKFYVLGDAGMGIHTDKLKDYIRSLLSAERKRWLKSILPEEKHIPEEEVGERTLKP